MDENDGKLYELTVIVIIINDDRCWFQLCYMMRSDCFEVKFQLVRIDIIEVNNHNSFAILRFNTLRMEKKVN